MQNYERIRCQNWPKWQFAKFSCRENFMFTATNLNLCTLMLTFNSACLFQLVEYLEYFAKDPEKKTVILACSVVHIFFFFRNPFSSGQR